MTRRPTLRVLAITLASALLVAGCLGSTAPDEPAPNAAEDATFLEEVSKNRIPGATEDLSDAIDPDHGGIPNGHAIQSLHTGSHGMELVGYNPLTHILEGESQTGQDSGYIAMDVWENYVCITHWIGTGGATIVDIEDPANPRVLSSVESGALNSDCQFTDDGKYMVLAAYLGVHEGLPGVPPPAGDVAAQGVLVYNVEDKANPEFLFHDTQGAGQDGYHNVFTAQINGTHYVFQTYTGYVLAMNEDATGLEIVSQVETANHDMWVGQHPVTGDWIMITGGGAGGTVIYDMNNPESPKVLGNWEGHDGLTGWHRQWPVDGLVDGRALMVVAGETGGGASLPYTVLDFTDPNNLTELGSWHIPGEPVSSDPNFFTMSAHEFEIWDGYVATGNYHAGVWMFDIGTLERAKDPVTLGYYLPHEVPQLNGGTTNKPFAFNPDVWGAYFDERGYVVTADWGTGLYVLKFAATKGEAGADHDHA